MAFLPNFTPEEEAKAQGGGPQNISGTSTVIQGGAGGKGSGGVGKPASGSWTNLNRYLDGNKETAGNMGNQIASNIVNTGDQARQSVNTASNDFNRASQQGSLQGLDTAKDEAGSIVNRAQTSQKAQQIGETEKTRFGQIANASYQGPQNLNEIQSAADASKNVQNTGRMAQQAGTEHGRFNLLAETFKRPTYNQGQKSLDNLLLQGNAQSRERLANAAAQVKDVGSYWQSAQEQAARAAQDLTQRHNDVRGFAQNTLNTGAQTRGQEVDKTLKDIEKDWTKNTDALKAVLSGYKGGDLQLTKEQASALGLQDGANLYNLLKNASPNAFLSTEAFDANKVVDQDQFAQLRALDELGGTFGRANTSRFVDEDLAGTLGLGNNTRSRLADAQKEQQNWFDDWSKSTVASGSSKKKKSQAAFDMGGIKAEASARQSIADYLAGNRADQRSSSDTYGLILGGYNNGRDALARQAQAEANSRLFNQIQNYLNEAGYNNRVRVV